MKKSFPPRRRMETKVLPDDRTRRDIDAVHKRVDRHDSRIQTLEQNMHNLDKVVALAVNRLDRMIELVTSISTTIRNSIVGLLIGIVLWVIAQMGGVL